MLLESDRLLSDENEQDVYNLRQRIARFFKRQTHVASYDNLPPHFHPAGCVYVLNGIKKS
jgi:hypothetical protein